MKSRMIIATLALIGFFVSVYLALWKFGFMGLITCGTGSCELVQTSEYAYLFGVPVAVIGAIGYAALFGVSIVGLQPGLAGRRIIATGLVGLSGLGLAFTAYLTYLEAFVIEAWCRWCLLSAGIIGAIFVAALAGLPAASGSETG